jgi:hypothetical protein
VAARRPELEFDLRAARQHGALFGKAILLFWQRILRGGKGHTRCFGPPKWILAWNPRLTEHPTARVNRAFGTVAASSLGPACSAGALSARRAGARDDQPHDRPDSGVPFYHLHYSSRAQIAATTHPRRTRPMGCHQQCFFAVNVVLDRSCTPDARRASPFNTTTMRHRMAAKNPLAGLTLRPPA